MRKTSFFIFLFIIRSVLSSQTSFDYATQPKSNEEPLGFVKYNTLTILFSSNSKKGFYGQRVLGLNNDGSIRFDVTKSTSMTSSPGQCATTSDKGMLTLSKVFYCLSSHNVYFFSKLTRIDSTGNEVFSLPPFGNIFSGVAQVSATNFIYSTDNNVLRFNGSTGASVAVVYSAQGTISCINTTPSQQIIAATNSVVALIDTLGSLLVSKPSTAKYLTIKAYKKTFYGLRFSGIVIDKLDSLLNITDSINTVSTKPVTDFSIYNDSIAVSFYNNLTELSSINIYPVNTLTAPLYFSNNIVKHKIVALQKDSTFNILSEEKRTDADVLNAVSANKRFNMGFTRLKSLSAFSYNNDIVLTRIKRQFFSSTSSSYSYKNSLVVKNNSLNAINYFRISHPMYINGMGSSNCGAYGAFNMFDTTIILNLLPNDSIEIQLPLLYAVRPYYSVPYSNPISLCYDLSVPNHGLENNIVNSSACIIGEEIGHDPTLYPNPAKKILTILYPNLTEIYSVIDLSGRVIFSGKESNDIDISCLSSGMYLLSFKINGTNFSKKFVKD